MIKKFYILAIILFILTNCNLSQDIKVESYYNAGVNIKASTVKSINDLISLKDNYDINDISDKLRNIESILNKKNIIIDIIESYSILLLYENKLKFLDNIINLKKQILKISEDKYNINKESLINVIKLSNNIQSDIEGLNFEIISYSNELDIFYKKTGYNFDSIILDNIFSNLGINSFNYLHLEKNNLDYLNKKILMGKYYRDIILPSFDINLYYFNPSSSLNDILNTHIYDGKINLYFSFFDIFKRINDIMTLEIYNNITTNTILQLKEQEKIKKELISEYIKNIEEKINLLENKNRINKKIYNNYINYYKSDKIKIDDIIDLLDEYKYYEIKIFEYKKKYFLLKMQFIYGIIL